MRLPVNHALPLAALLFAGGVAHAKPMPAPTEPSGPAADYPVMVGEPFTIGSTTWTPADQLNYDAVGYASVSGEGLVGVSGAHKTLPLPSYIEVTSLDTGRTILVRLTQRGPMVNDTLVGLSPAAASQLGIGAGSRAAVRIRRVNPPEVERAALRTGGSAPLRMDTPESLLKVLRRKLSEQSPLMPPPSTPPKMPTDLPAAKPDAPPPVLAKLPSARASSTKPAPPKVTPARSATETKPSVVPPAQRPIVPMQKPEHKPTTAKPPVGAAAKRTSSGGTHVVQVAAFSTAERARKVAAQLGGQVSQVGKLWRVRLGPFKGGGEAAPALEKAKAAGYSDARIQRAD